MKQTDFLDKLQEIEDFIRQIRDDAKKINGVNRSNHTYLVGKTGYSPVAAISHKCGSCSVYFHDDHFSFDMWWEKTHFTASIRRGVDIDITNSNIRSYLSHGDKFKQLWEIAKSINSTSIAQREIDGIEARIQSYLREVREMRKKLKALEVEHGV